MGFLGIIILVVSEISGHIVGKKNYRVVVHEDPES